MKYKSKIICLRSDGKILNLSDKPWTVSSVQGIDFPDYELFTEKKGYGDGAFILGKRKEPRQIEIVALINSALEEEYKVNRTKALTFFNSNYTFDVEFQRFGKTRILRDAEIMSAHFPSTWYQKNPELQVCLLSPYSNLFRDSEQSLNLSNVKNNWHNVRWYTPEHSLVFSTREQSNRLKLDYDGSEPAHVNAEICATGYVKNIKLRVGDNIAKINVELRNGDNLKIDKFTVYKNNQILNYRNYSMSEIMSLTLNTGENLIEITTELGDAFDVKITYSAEYGGL